MKYLHLGILAEIVDRSGIVRVTGGCSIIGRHEFAFRMNRIAELLEAAGDVPWIKAIGESRELQLSLDRAMELNSLKTEWFTPEQIEGLLFKSEEDGKVLPGWLVRLNTPKAGTSNYSGKPQSVAEQIACLSEDIEKAMALASEVPAHLAIEINAARAEMMKTPEQRQADKESEAVQSLRKDSSVLEKLRGLSGQQ